MIPRHRSDSAHFAWGPSALVRGGVFFRPRTPFVDKTFVDLTKSQKCSTSRCSPPSRAWTPPAMW
jgi:hypothetical protein